MQRVKDRQKLSWQGMFYSIQRIDLLIISISGASIYVCLETLKYINDNSLENSCLIKVSGFLFLFTILLNFVSQFLGKKSNSYDYLMCENELDFGDEPSDEEKIIISTLDTKSEIYSNLTEYFNISSAIIMFVGLFLLITYFMTNF